MHEIDAAQTIISHTRFTKNNLTQYTTEIKIQNKKEKKKPSKNISHLANCTSAAHGYALNFSRLFLVRSSYCLSLALSVCTGMEYSHWDFSQRSSWLLSFWLHPFSMESQRSLTHSPSFSLLRQRDGENNEFDTIKTMPREKPKKWKYNKRKHLYNLNERIKDEKQKKKMYSEKRHNSLFFIDRVRNASKQEPV